MKLLSPTLHSALDYVVVTALLSAPFFLSLTGLISILAYSLGAVHLLLTVLTYFPFGVIKIIPFKLHGHIELLVSVVLVTTPLYIGNLTALDSKSEEFFLGGFGVFVFITWLFSDYNAADK